MMTSNDHISPIKCALKFKPPLLVIVYNDLNSGKTRRRTIPLRGFSKSNDVGTYANQLLNNPRHSDYVSKLPRQQLDSLLQKIKDSHNGVTPSPIHTSVLGIPPLTSPSRQDDVKQLNLDFDAALAELLGTDDDDDVSTTKQSGSKESPDIRIPTTLGSSSKNGGMVSPAMRLPPVSKLPPLNNSSSLTSNNQLSFKDKSDTVTETPLPLSTPHSLSLPSSHQSTIDGRETKKPWLSSVSHPKMEDKNEPEVPDYSADFNSESEKSVSALTPNVKHDGFRHLDDDHSLSFAVEELDQDDDSLSLSEDEGAGDKLLVSSSGEDFRALNIFTPPPQVEPILEAASHSLPNGHSKHDCEEDLNKVDDEYLARKKAEMDAQFTANQLNPGDEGYVYDKEIEFDNGPKIESGWDSDGNDSYSDF